MQSSSTSFCASLPHPPLVFIGLLKFLTWFHGADLPNAVWKKGVFSSCPASLLSLSSKHLCLPFPRGTHWELMWNYLPLLIPKFSATSLLFQNAGCHTGGLCWVFFLGSRFCVWLRSNRSSQPAFTNALRCKLSRPANFKCLSLLDAV